jgi:hypothetical protein
MGNKLHYRELMIGNYVKINNPKHRPNDNGRLAITLEVRQDSVSLQLINDECGINSFGQLLEFIEGVPLTEEILIKCGFVKKKQSSPEYWFKSSNKKFTFCKWKTNSYINLTNCKGLSADIHYIHELQNLYFTLTKQHLEIKL